MRQRLKMDCLGQWNFVLLSAPEQQSINQIEPQINTLSDKLSEVKLEESMDEAMSVARLRLRKVQVT